jgi:predicted lipid-binding transport protein (Tim44 family)
VTQRFGWRGLFFIAGGFGVVFGVLCGAVIASRAKTAQRRRASSRTSKPAAAAEYAARARVQLERHRRAALHAR